MKVRLHCRVRSANGKRQYVDPVYAAIGELKPLHALVDGKQEHHSEGTRLPALLRCFRQMAGAPSPAHRPGELWVNLVQVCNYIDTALFRGLRCSTIAPHGYAHIAD